MLMQLFVRVLKEEVRKLDRNGVRLRVIGDLARFDPELQAQCARYAGPKCNLQFPLDEPVPLALIEKIVAARLAENRARKSAQA